MKRFLIILTALLFAVSAYAEKLPDVKLQNQKGEQVSTKQLLKGKPIVLLCWSTTCKPCILELKTINEQIEEWREAADFDIVVISVDDSRSSSKAKAMAAGFGWDFNCLYDKNQNFKRAMNISLIPQSYIIDADGEVVYAHTGYNVGSEQELLDKLVEISGKKAGNSVGSTKQNKKQNKKGEAR